MDPKSFSSKLGELKVTERLPDFWNIEQYLCTDENSVFLVKLYKFFEFQEFFQRELQMTEALSNIQDIILPISDSQLNKSFGYIIYNCTRYWSLSTKIHPKGFSDPFRLFSSILAAVDKFHKTGLIHTGLHIQTILFNSEFQVKILGFETCTTLEEINNTWRMNKPLILTQEQEYKAPELCDSGYLISQSIDLWSLGCIFYVILTGDRELKDLEDNKINFFKDIKNIKGKTILQKLFIVDPELRGTIESIKAIIESQLPEQEKRVSAIKQILSRSTKSWVRNVTKDKESAPKSIIIAKILKKAAQKPEKIPKFYNHLSSSSFYKPRVVLKSLFLLHTYIFVGKIQDICPASYEVLHKIRNTWTNPHSRQKYFSGSTKQIVLEYVSILEHKLRIHQEFQIPCNWSDYDLSTINAEEIFEYFKNLSKFVNIVFNMNEHVQIYIEILKILLKEILQVAQIFVNGVDRLQRTEMVQELLETRTKNSVLIQKVYVKYPFLEIPVLNEYLGHSLSQIISIEKGLLESMSNLSSICTSPANESFSSESDKNEAASSRLMDFLEFDEMIAEGGSAQVFRGTYKSRPVAIKKMRTSQYKNDFLTEFNREINTLSKLSHPNLVTFIGACVGDPQCIVTEYCSGNTLFSLLHEKKSVKLSWAQRNKFALDIARGMNYLHTINPPVLHRDLKSLNILLSEPVLGLKDFPLAKISDFGVSRVMGEGMVTGNIGTCHWMAPEVIKNEPYGLPSDVYSFGIVMYEILARETPYKGIEPKFISYQVVNMKKRPDINLIPGTCPDELKSVMIRCWNENPAKRPTFAEIVRELSSLKVLLN